MRHRLIYLCAALFLLPGLSAAQPQERVVKFATGSPAGVYFPVGVALCRLVNETRAQHGIRCAAIPTEGSVANIEELSAKEVDLAMVQSDLQKEAFEGSSSSPFEDLRAVLSLYPETITVVARQEAGISDFSQLVGKRISAGPVGSGQRDMWERLMTVEGWTEEDMPDVQDLSSSLQASALCDNQIDAFVTTIGHPALTIQEATLSCGAVIVPVGSPAIDQLIADDPAFVNTSIPGGLYAGNAEDIPTFGVTATVVTRADVPDDVIDVFVGSALRNLERLRGFDTALSSLDPERMAREGLAAPLHPGAQSAFDAEAAETPSN
ncbi:MAG: TAXI family TRAP transporter solute-binding subunit [Pseudomonadota bacterium]